MYEGEAYYQASLAEPLSCSIGALNAAYHTQMGVYTHEMGIREGGNLAITAGAGPMGLGALTYFIKRLASVGRHDATSCGRLDSEKC